MPRYLERANCYLPFSTGRHEAFQAVDYNKAGLNEQNAKKYSFPSL